MVNSQTVSANGAAPTGTGGALPRKEFFAEVVEGVRGRLPAELASFRVASNQSLLKIHYANERVHYEVWLNSHLRTAEIGLHFEDGPISTAAYLTYFDRFIVELKDQLGTNIELERWTQSWGHLYEVAPLQKLSERLAKQTARRLADLIQVLQPLVDEADVPPERSVQPTPTFDAARRWGRKHR